MVTIVIRPKHIERFLFILIIVVLAVLLVTSYMNNSCSKSTATKDSELGANTNSSNQTLVAEEDPSLESEPKSEPEPEVVATCDDGVKNQDETNIDCGGACTSDNGAYYYNTACHKTQKVEVQNSLNIDKVSYEGGESTSAKLESMTIDLTNGQGKSEVFKLEVYVKDRYNSYFLNQLDGSYRGDPFTIETIVIGKDQTISNKKVEFVNAASPYILQNDYYAAGDPFMIEVIVKDSDGEQVMSKTSKVITP